MSNSGLVVVGANGRIQIDSAYQNIFVAASGTGGAIPAVSNFTVGAKIAFQSPTTI